MFWSILSAHCEDLCKTIKSLKAQSGRAHGIPNFSPSQSFYDCQIKYISIKFNL